MDGVVLGNGGVFAAFRSCEVQARVLSPVEIDNLHQPPACSACTIPNRLKHAVPKLHNHQWLFSCRPAGGLTIASSPRLASQARTPKLPFGQQSQGGPERAVSVSILSRVQVRVRVDACFVAKPLLLSYVHWPSCVFPSLRSLEHFEGHAPSQRHPSTRPDASGPIIADILNPDHHPPLNRDLLPED